MLYDKNHTQDFLVDANVDPLLAAQVANTLDGVASASAGQLEDKVQFDFVTPAKDWPQIASQLRSMPSSMVEFEDVPTSSGKMIEVTLWVNTGEMAANDAQASLDAMLPADVVDFDVMLDDEDEIAAHNNQ